MQHLSFGLCLMSKPESQVVEDKKKKKSKKIKITREAKLEAQSLDVIPPFSLSLFLSHLTPHEAWPR